MSVLRITSTLLGNHQGSGIIVPDKDGYRDVMLGALNVFNGANSYYSAREALSLFREGSALIRRCRKGALGIELDHPSKLPGWTHDEYVKRICEIERKNTCGHIAELIVDLDFGKNNPDIAARDTIGIRGKVIPSGPHAQVLERDFNNPRQNLPFSVRAISDDYRLPSGVVERHLTRIITWDYVTEPGIAIADRHTSVSLESRQCTAIEASEELIEVNLFKDILHNALENVALESNEGEFYKDLLLGIEKTKRYRSKLSDW